MVYGYDPLTQEYLIQQAIDSGWENITGSWPQQPSPEDFKEQCKETAMSLLSATDWSALAQVSDPVYTPHLLNPEEFATYRSQLREYAVNPVVDPVWPTQPTAVWSS